MQDTTNNDDIRKLYENGKISGTVSSFDDFIMEFIAPDDTEEEEEKEEEEDNDSHEHHGGQKYYGKKKTDSSGEEDEEKEKEEEPVSHEMMEDTNTSTGFGSQSFYFSKNGDASNYFFKIGEGDEHRCYVLTIGKFSKYGHPVQNKAQYGVFGLIELPEAVLDQAVLDKGQFETNDNKIELSEKQFLAFLEQVTLCVTDYLQKDPKCETFFDEMQDTVKVVDYDNQLAMSVDNWPGGRDTWKFQVVEKGKLNTIGK